MLQRISFHCLERDEPVEVITDEISGMTELAKWTFSRSKNNPFEHVAICIDLHVESRSDIDAVIHELENLKYELND
jgi:hypothetical protein